MDYRPIRRMHDLVMTEEQDEIVVYDERLHHIHHFNATVAAVWRMCDGTRTVQQIADNLTDGLPAARRALTLLEDAMLLETPLASHVPLTGSRRDFIRKAGIAAVPAIVSISAPRASAAASHPDPGGDLCYTNAHCDFPRTCDYVPEMGDIPGNCGLF